METKTIEKLDKQRYWAVALETLGLFISFIEILWSYIKLGAEPNALMFQGNGLILLMAGGIWYGIIWNKARRDKQVKDALYNEMYMQNKYRYQRLTMWVMIAACFLSICPLLWIINDPKYPYVIVSEMIMLLGLLTMKVSWLIYNRR